MCSCRCLLCFLPFQHEIAMEHQIDTSWTNLASKKCLFKNHFKPDQWDVALPLPQEDPLQQLEHQDQSLECVCTCVCMKHANIHESNDLPWTWWHAIEARIDAMYMFSYLHRLYTRKKHERDIAMDPKMPSWTSCHHEPMQQHEPTHVHATSCYG